MNIISRVESSKNRSPRGDCYEWCELLSNDTLRFGDEQGNYAGGTYLSYNFYKLVAQDENHVPTDEYWDQVYKLLGHFQKKDPSYYSEIYKMCEDNNSKIFISLCEKYDR